MVHLSRRNALAAAMAGAAAANLTTASAQPRPNLGGYAVNLDCWFRDVPFEQRFALARHSKLAASATPAPRALNANFCVMSVLQVKNDCSVQAAAMAASIDEPRRSTTVASSASLAMKGGASRMWSP